MTASIGDNEGPKPYTAEEFADTHGPDMSIGRLLATIAARDERMTRLLGALDEAIRQRDEAERRNAARDEEIARLRSFVTDQEQRIDTGVCSWHHPEDFQETKARVAQLEAIAGDALNELEAVLDGKPNPNAREFLGFMKDKLDKVSP